MSGLPRVAVIGCGRIGQIHGRNLRALNDLCELVIVDDVMPGVAESVARQLGVSRFSTDSQATIADATTDAVVICSTTETHAPFIELAAQHGKDIFVEKPIALDLEATHRALQAVDAAGVRLQVGFQRRFDRSYLKARAMIGMGDIGRIEMIRDVMRDPSPPPATYLLVSGGLYRDMTIHNFDCVRWFMGESPVTIHATASALVSDDIRAAGDVDTSVVTMTFAGGQIATIENSRRSGFGYDVRTEVFGSRGGLMIGDHRDTAVTRYTDSGVIEDHQYFFLERFRDAYRDEMVSFLTAIRDDIDVAVTGSDALAAMQLAFAAAESLRTGQTVMLA